MCDLSCGLKKRQTTKTKTKPRTKYLGFTPGQNCHVSVSCGDVHFTGSHCCADAMIIGILIIGNADDNWELMWLREPNPYQTAFVSFQMSQFSSWLPHKYLQQ